MTVTEFISDKALVATWKKELENNQLLKLVLSILDEGAPINQEINNMDSLWIAYGYNKYSQQLKNLALAIEIPKPLRTSYAAPKKSTE